MSQKSCVRASKVRVRTALLARFRAFIAARCAAYDFLFARNARIFAARQSLATKTTKIRAYSVRFHLSKELLLLPRRVFGVCALAHCFPGAFLGFSRVRTASPTRFRGKCACALLAWRVFGLLALAHGFPRAFSAFSRLRTAFLARFGAFIAARCAAYRVFLRKTRAVLAKTTKIRGAFSGFKSARSLWRLEQKL